MKQSIRPTVAPRAPLVASALRRCLARGYGLSELRQDILASLVVGIIAVPLSMALAIGTGIPPEHGLYTAMVAGAVCALTGGADLQVTGPTAAFVMILVPVVQRFGLGGLCLATTMAGLMLVLAALLRLGKYVRLVPHPVTLGFTGGIGVTIAVLQIKDFFGLPIGPMPETFFGKIYLLAEALPNLRPADTAVGVVTLILLALWPRVTSRIPAPLIALAAGASLSALFRAFGLGTPSHISDRFSYMLHGVRYAGIPRNLPVPGLKWFTIDVPAQMSVYDLSQAVLPSAIAIAALAALESLLAAVVADRMSGRRHDSDSELLGAGLANIVAPFFGGFAATGAIARTAANIRSGAKTPLASVFHTVFILLAIVSLAPVLSQLPMAAMSALLLQVAWKMADARGIRQALRTQPRTDGLVLLASMLLTITYDMVIGVLAGVALATALFARGMALATRGEGEPATASSGLAAREPDASPEHLRFVVEGALFFAAGDQIFAPLDAVGDDIRRVTLDLRQVHVVDASGLVAVEYALAALRGRGIDVAVLLPTDGAAAQALVNSGVAQAA